jgi:hypothetical protein
MKYPEGYMQAITDPYIRRIVKENMIYNAGDRLTICEQVRFAYDFVEQLPDSRLKQAIVKQLVDIMGTAKKMDSRLAHYYRKYGDKTGRRGSSIAHLIDTSHRKRRRRARM